MPAGLRKAETRAPCQNPTWYSRVRIVRSDDVGLTYGGAYEEGAGGCEEDIAAGSLLAKGIACELLEYTYPYSWGMDAMRDMIAGLCD